MKCLSKAGIKGRFRIKEIDPTTGRVLRTGEWIDNLITEADTHGLNMIMRALLNESISLGITRARIGMDNTAPAVTDTDLVDPLVYDIEIANRTQIDETTIRIDFFIPNVYLPDDTYREFATYCGTKLFSRALISPDFVKVGNVDVSVEYEYTIANA